MTIYSRPIFNIPVIFSRSPITYKTVSFTSPSNLTANGTLGGDSFAVQSWARQRVNGTNEEFDKLNYTNISKYPAYLAFDSSTSTFCVIPAYPDEHGYLIIYNPDPINIENIAIKNRNSDYGIRSFYLQYSDDGENYTNLEYFTCGNTPISSWWNITVTPYNGYHKYYRFEIDRGSKDLYNYTNVQMTNIVINGTKRVIL